MESPLDRINEQITTLKDLGKYYGEEMNLIEQLGGYAKAKECLNTPTARECIKNELRDALLQYRRENNIFEIGDFVVNEIPETISALFQVETLTPKLKKPKTLKCGRWGNYPVGCNSVRHASDKEIAQGYRDE